MQLLVRIFVLTCCLTGCSAPPSFDADATQVSEQEAPFDFARALRSFMIGFSTSALLAFACLASHSDYRRDTY